VVWSVVTDNPRAPFQCIDFNDFLAAAYPADGVIFLASISMYQCTHKSFQYIDKNPSSDVCGLVFILVLVAPPPSPSASHLHSLQ